jgi:hypothetical protein
VIRIIDLPAGDLVLEGAQKAAGGFIGGVVSVIASKLALPE